MTMKFHLKSVGYALLSVVASIAPASAQATTGDSSSMLCNVMTTVFSAKLLTAVAVAAILYAVWDMWRHGQNPVAWIREHVGVLIFAGVLLGFGVLLPKMVPGAAACYTPT
jgi:hypothetical protein